MVVKSDVNTLELKKKYNLIRYSPFHLGEGWGEASHPIPRQPPKRRYKVFVINQLVLPKIVPPTVAFIYGIAQFLADSVNANGRHWQHVFLSEYVGKHTFGKSRALLIRILFVVRNKTGCINTKIFHTNSGNGIKKT